MTTQTLDSIQPWLANKRWADGKIRDDSGGAIIGLTIFGLVWNAIAWVIFVVAWRDGDKTGNAIYVVALFPAIGVAIIVGLLFAIHRRMKYGRSVLELETLPGAIGGWLAGTIHTPVILDAPESVHLTLQCVRRITTGSGKNRHTSETVVWLDEQSLRPQLPRDGMLGCQIPLVFAIPASAEPTGGPRDNQIIWRLQARASTPGLDYAASFFVPVFAIPTMQATPKTEAAAAKLRLPAPPVSQRAGEARIGFSRDTADRLRFEFPAARNPGPAIFATLFGMLFAGAGLAMMYFGAGFFFSSIFTLVGLAVLFGAANMWFKARSLFVRREGVEIRWRMLGMGGTINVPADQITAVKYKSNMQQGSTPYYQVRLHGSAPNPLVAAAGLLLADAKWVTEEIAKTLGVESGSES